MNDQTPRTEQGRWLLDHQGLINATGGMRGDSIDLRQSILTIEAEAAPLDERRGHEWCIPHEHVEPDPEKWERDQARSLAEAAQPAPEDMEAEAGRLLVASARARLARMGPDDAHEVRHLGAAIEAGNSDDEEPFACRLDAQPAPLDDPCPHCDMEHVWPCPTIPRCDEPGCEQEATCGWPTRPGGTGPNGGYRRTCGLHMKGGERD